MQTYTIPNLINVDTSLLDSNQQKVFEYYKKFTKNGTNFSIVEKNETVRKPIELLVEKLNEKQSKQKSTTRKTATATAKPKKTTRKKTTKTTTILFKSGDEVIITKDYSNLKKGQILEVIYDVEKGKKEVAIKTGGIVSRGYHIPINFVKKVSNTTKKTSTRKTSTRKTTTRKTKKTSAKQVNNVDLQISIIKSFYLMLDKEVPRSRVLTLYRKIEKAALEKTIRKKDKYSKEIEAISKELAKQWNKNKNYVTISVIDSEKEMLKKIAYSETQRTSVRLLKRFAYLIGKEEVAKVKRLIKAIEKAKISKSDPYFDEIQTALKKLEKYLKDKKEIEMSEADLRGLQGILKHPYDDFDYDYEDEDGNKLVPPFLYYKALDALVGEYGRLTENEIDACQMLISAFDIGEVVCDDNLFVVEQITKNNKEFNREDVEDNDEYEDDEYEDDELMGVKEYRKKKKDKLDGIEKNNGIISSISLKGIDFDNYEFTDEWAELIGNPSKPFYLMIYGKPGSGKSTVTIKFAKYLANKQDLKVLYFAKEEGASQTFKEKLERLNAFDKNLYIAENMPSDLQNYDVFIIDSVSDAHLTPEDIEAMQKQYPQLSLILIFHTTKDGQFRGLNTWEHWVQTVVEVKDGIATTGKNRFGTKGEINIFD